MGSHSLPALTGPVAMVAALSLACAAGVATASQASAALPPAGARPAAAPSPRVSRFDQARLARMDSVVERAIAAKEAPGAVVVVGDSRGNVFERAYGRRAVEPAVEPMTLDTVFDAASLTKVIATTSAVMLLIEEGRLRLTDRVASHIPDFARYGKEPITIRHLMTHMSGLRPDVDLTFPWRGAEEAIRLACEEVPVARPDERMIYSDINFFLLGEVVRRVSGEPLEQFVRTRVFQPLGMIDTGFLPGEALRGRIAPTERCSPYGWPCDTPDAVMLRGVVHDPTARRMGGVAGHAGLFTTARDLSRFARMLLNGGSLDGVRLMAPLTVTRMASPSTPRGERNVRGLGWDIDSSFSTNRGELMGPGSFGHTGFTGTSIWIDPGADLFVIFLSSRLHPHGKGDVGALRARVATLAAASLLDRRLAGDRAFGAGMLQPSGAIPGRGRTGEVVMTGIDVLRAEGFARLRGRRIGLVTNHTGRARDGATTIDLLHAARNLTLVALFSPEHGIRGVMDEKVASSVDEKTGLTIHSLYGETRRPNDEMLKGIDTLVVDIQDVGARFYTYVSTMALVMEEAAKRDIEVVVLDRPNPLNGWQIEGPTLDGDALGFTGYFPMPIRHGMTMGELARLFNGENKIGAKLTVVEVKGWSRERWFDETGLPWVNPSPNMRNLLQATLYPGIGAIEWANVSVGRGTDTPFEQVGAPWISGVNLAAALASRDLPGVTFYPVSFTPTSSKYAGQACEGVFIVITDRAALRPVRVGLEIAAALQRLYPTHFSLQNTGKLFGSADGLRRVLAGEDPQQVAAAWTGDEAKWRLLRAKYLLY